MQKGVRIAILATVVVMIAVSAFGAIGYMSFTSTGQNQTQNSIKDFFGAPFIIRQWFSELKQILAQNQSIRPTQLQRALNFLKNANATTFTGSIVLISNKLMVLNVTGETVNIIMAQKWVVGSTVLTLHELFVNGTLSNGQQITVSALVAGQGHVYVAWGYKIMTSTGTISALLPFNVK
ncbi:hypothetical protein MUP77_09900 [Candidatus Bathyarchaeota archaeon]|nr:hypothetical protein [Candidatus Bathyarchaeota archaeon]